MGSSAKEIAALLPPELLRFLMLRTRPKTVINFAPNYETTTRLFRDYDSLMGKYQALQETDAENSTLPEDLMPLFYAQLGEAIKPNYLFDLSTLISLLQVPHLDIQEEVRKRSPKALSDEDWRIAEQRIAVAQKWLQDYADEEEKLVLYVDKMPEKAKTLNQDQLTYLEKLVENLGNVSAWEGDELQTALFSTSKQLEIQQSIAFKAVYLCFLGKERGPKAGALLSYLDKSFVIERLQEVLN